MDKICHHCNKEFVGSKNSKFCCSSCSAKSAVIEKRKTKFNDKNQLLCGKCKIYKDQELFNRHKAYIHRNGREPYCKKCAYETKRHQIFNAGEDIDRYITGILHKINYRQRLKTGTKSNITIEDIKQLIELQQGKCAISGIKFSYFLGGRGRVHDNVSIDRIDSSKGYELNNIHLVTYRVNVMKQDTPIMEFIEICKKIYENSTT